jgi:N-glycosylase/DNA lyase
MMPKKTCIQRSKNWTLEYQSDKAMSPPREIVGSTTGPSYLIRAEDFNLEATLESGQVFGFRRSASRPGAFVGRIAGRTVELGRRGAGLAVFGEVPAAEIRAYLDLERDLAPVYGFLRERAELERALEAFRGLRLIRQDPWQALAGFILSSNNNVKRIQLIWSNLCGMDGNADGAFPEPGRIARCHERRLRELGLGYRAPFLQRSAQFVHANPGCLEAIRDASYGEARERVLAFPGIGPKVADCVLLYGFQKFEAFPVDVWIARAMRKLYFRGRNVSDERLRAYARSAWGGWAGYVQQYIFHAARLKVLDV